jgi:uncharacterized protein DUF5666
VTRSETRSGAGPRPTGHRVDRLGARALGLILATAGLLALAHGQEAHGAGDPVASLKPGHWVQLEGPLEADSAASCDELRILTGDFVDDDWALRGYAQSVDTLKNEITIAGIRAQVSENTAFDSPNPDFRGLADLTPGLLVEIEGTYLKNRRFLAHEVDDETDEMSRHPWPRNRIRIVARVEKLDPRRRLVTAMGFVFQLTDKTRVRSVIE